MKRYEKRMIFLILILLTALSIKSLLLDPVRPETIELDLYQQYAQLTAPFQGNRGPDPEGLYTYRTVMVEKTGDEGQTHIVYEDAQTNEMIETILPGQYQARVRGYLLYILPVKLIRVEGGLKDDGSDS
ncbi:MAG: hypothetical protein SCK57_05735 [Bacillota bacterium]|nr:hypothetical protein [Bacillota bacterium]MDW7677143.1 hypothetical protein [Bacillota bacterium]